MMFLDKRLLGIIIIIEITHVAIVFHLFVYQVIKFYLVDLDYLLCIFLKLEFIF